MLICLVVVFYNCKLIFITQALKCFYMYLCSIKVSTFLQLFHCPFYNRVITKQWTGGRWACWSMRWQQGTRRFLLTSQFRSMKRLYQERWVWHVQTEHLVLFALFKFCLISASLKGPILKSIVYIDTGNRASLHLFSHGAAFNYLHITAHQNKCTDVA